MKKLLFVAVAFAALSLTSCDHKAKTEKAPQDTTVVDTLEVITDTVNTPAAAPATANTPNQ